MGQHYSSISQPEMEIVAPVQQLALNSNDAPAGCITILDWDDTLFPTSFLKAQQLQQNGLSSSAEMRRLEDVVLDLLTKAANLGQVCIMSNSAQGWVHQSASRYMPRVGKFLQDHVWIVHTKRFQSPERNVPLKWKIAAFLHVVSSYLGPQPRGFHSLISVGDSHLERVSLGMVASVFGLKFKNFASLKLQERPHTVLLTLQLGLLCDGFSCLAEKEGKYDLVFDFDSRTFVEVENQGNQPFQVESKPKEVGDSSSGQPRAPVADAPVADIPACLEEI